MTTAHLDSHDRLGLLHPSIDAHTLGVSSIGELLALCGIPCLAAPAEVEEAACRLDLPGQAGLLGDWLRANGVTALGFSYRLDPQEGLRLFSSLMETLAALHVLASDGGRLRTVFFAGLPATCDLVMARHPEVAACFRGDESPLETLALLGLPESLLPESVTENASYDESRLRFGRDLVRKADYLGLGPIDRSGYPGYGRRGDTVVDRMAHSAARGLPPLMRAHVGPYLADRKDAVGLFLDWTARLAKGGLLDVLSIGSSQLSQSEFGRPWDGLPDGGGVPLASPAEFSEVWKAARPMLVRSYAGTRDVESMARMLEANIDNAWHALSLWWFCKIDGRGPNTVLENLEQHIATLRYIASVGKPFEPNVPHHFAFRGGDDLTYVLSGLVAAKAAKAAGVRRLIAQTMLNTPKQTWGICDLAKARALLSLLQEMEEGDFRVYLQPRGGLDYFSGDPEKAKAQLAAVTALMDDIEPALPSSPQIIHVVSYSEGYALADPDIVNDSVRLTRHALAEYRRMRKDGAVEDMSTNPLVLARTSELVGEARAALACIESTIRDPYSARGLYEIMASGFFAVPYLWECREDFAAATRWKTRAVSGAIRVVGDDGSPVSLEERLGTARETALLREGRRARAKEVE